MTNKAGKLIKASSGYWAFVPAPLPPELAISWEIAAQLSEADRNLSELAGIARNLPNPHLLIRPFIQKEAVLSSRIEGTQASLSDLLYFEASGGMESKVSDVKEVANYVKALEYGLDRQTKLPLSLRLIREMHNILMQDVRGRHMTPGEFRRSQNWIGPAGCTLMEAAFVPPPPHEMHEALDNFEKYLHHSSKLPPLIRIALIHYQFEVIHPFLDGNGRIGRLLITFLLCADQLISRPLLYLSVFFEKNRQVYYKLLLGVSQKGEWLPWILFFLQGVAEQSKDAINRSRKLFELRKDYRNTVQSVRTSALTLKLVDELFANPAITVSSIAKLLKVTKRSAQMNIHKLMDNGILQEVTGRERNRIFVASEILNILNLEKA